MKLHSVPPVNDFSGKEDVRSSIAFNVSDEFQLFDCNSSLSDMAQSKDRRKMTKKVQILRSKLKRLQDLIKIAKYKHTLKQLAFNEEIEDLEPNQTIAAFEKEHDIAVQQVESFTLASDSTRASMR